MSLLVLVAIVAGVAGVAVRLALRYRRELEAGRARLAAVERHVIATRWGQVEYAEEGSGAPVLVVHGIYQHCVSGLESVRGLLPGRRVIAPPRFGYLGSSLPPNASVADQADAFVALLDALGIDRIDVVAESAGTPSALQLTLRHPDRVQHLAVLVGNFPGSPTAVVQPPWAKRISATDHVGVEDHRPIVHGSADGGSSEDILHDERGRPGHCGVHRQPVSP
jgi:pimeloyl-ACP methyl ester carboxylesterase